MKPKSCNHCIGFVIWDTMEVDWQFIYKNIESSVRNRIRKSSEGYEDFGRECVSWFKFCPDCGVGLR